MLLKHHTAHSLSHCKVLLLQLPGREWGDAPCVCFLVVRCLFPAPFQRQVVRWLAGERLGAAATTSTPAIDVDAGRWRSCFHCRGAGISWGCDSGGGWAT